MGSAKTTTLWESANDSRNSKSAVSVELETSAYICVTWLRDDEISEVADMSFLTSFVPTSKRITGAMCMIHELCEFECLLSLYLPQRANASICSSL